MEVAVIELSGPSFANTDARLVCLQALRCGMTHAIVFDSSGKVTEPSGVLRKRPLIVERGRFETVEPYETQMLRASEAELKRTVVVSDFPLPYLLIDYLRRHTTEPIRLVVGVATLAQILRDRFYGGRAGGLLEGVGKLLAANVKVYAYPVPADRSRQAMAGAEVRCTGAADDEALAPFSRYPSRKGFRLRLAVLSGGGPARWPSGGHRRHPPLRIQINKIVRISTVELRPL
jgi:hypothetical protein